MILGYWDFRGLAEPARLMLNFMGIDFEDKRYKDVTDWSADKYTLGFDFPNLPYLIDGDIKITESVALYRYLGRKSELFPRSETERRDCDVIESIANDLRLRMSLLAYLTPDVTKKLHDTQSFCVERTAQVDRFLSGKKFVAGEQLTYVDFMLFEFLIRIEILFSGIYEDKTNVKSFMRRFSALEPIDRYLKSDTYKTFPVNGPEAYWGGKSYDDRTW